MLNVKPVNFYFLEDLLSVFKDIAGRVPFLESMVKIAFISEVHSFI